MAPPAATVSRGDPAFMPAAWSAHRFSSGESRPVTTPPARLPAGAQATPEKLVCVRHGWLKPLAACQICRDGRRQDASCAVSVVGGNPRTLKPADFPVFKDQAVAADALRRMSTLHQYRAVKFPGEP